MVMARSPVILAAPLQLGYPVIQALRTWNETDRPVGELKAWSRGEVKNVLPTLHEAISFRWRLNLA
jgi:hypothetical protein